MRESFRRFKVRPRLRTLARDLGRKLSESIAQARQAVQDWQQHALCDHVLPRGRDGLAVIRALTQWVLDFPADSSYQSFPYDRPYLDLYDRCSRARRAAATFLRCLPDDRALRRSLDRFCSILDPILCDASTAQLTTTLRARAALFDELRDTLRLVLQPTRCERSTEDSAKQLRDICEDLRHWVSSLRQRRPERGPAKDTREAIDLILDHMERHGDFNPTLRFEA